MLSSILFKKITCLNLSTEISKFLTLKVVNRPFKFEFFREYLKYREQYLNRLNLAFA